MKPQISIKESEFSNAFSEYLVFKESLIENEEYLIDEDLKYFLTCQMNFPIFLLLREKKRDIIYLNVVFKNKLFFFINLLYILFLKYLIVKVS